MLVSVASQHHCGMCMYFPVLYLALHGAIFNHLLGVKEPQN